MKTRNLVLSIALLAQSFTAMAAQQCLTKSGQYGTLAVSSCANDPNNGIENPTPNNMVPFGSPFGNGSGFTLGGRNGLLTCTFTLSHPVLTSTVRIDADVIDLFEYRNGEIRSDELIIELDGNPYAFAATDILQSPMNAVGVQPKALAVNASGNIVATRIGLVVDQFWRASGTMQLANNAPTSVSKIKVSMQASALGGNLRLCLDDAAPAPAAATPVPATNAVTLALLSMGLAFAGFFGFRRRKQNR